MPRPLHPLAPLAVAVALFGCQAGSSPSPSVTEVSPVSMPGPYAGAEAIISVALGPRGLAISDGSIWVASTRGNLVQRVDPASNEVTAEIQAGQRPVTPVTIDGSLWVSVLNGEASSDDELVRIDPATDAVDLRVTVPVFHNVAAGAGAIWVVDGVGQLRRVDAASGELSEAIAAGANTVGLAADDIAVWGIRGDRMVWRYPATGGELLEAELGAAVPGRSRVAVGAGAVWVAVPGTLRAFDPQGLDLIAELAMPGMEMVNDLFVRPTDVWLSANVTDPALGLDGGSVLRIDPGSLEVLEVFRLGPESSGVMVGDGSLWAVDQQDHQLARFPLGE
jgi:streptogramin lyase